MAKRVSNLHFGLLILALALAGLLWGVAHGSSSIELGFDVPVELDGVKDTLVVTDMSVDSVNVRVMGSRAALRNVSPGKLKYLIDVSGGNPGNAEYEVDASRIELPRGARIVSRSPSHIGLRFEKRGRKAVGVRPDLAGEPAEGFQLAEVVVEPRRVWLAGARSQVLRLDEVVTEPIDLAGLDETEEREVRLLLGGGTVWMEENEPVKVTLVIEPVPAPEVEGAQEAEEAEAQTG